jgi:RNA polymerase sigma factor (TIGR02999 family)
MDDAHAPDVTRLLQAVGRGEEGAGDALLERIYGELRSIAGAELGGGDEQTLHPTELVHEAYLRLIERDASTWESRRNFFFAAARAMRDVLVEKARRKAALKRGRGWARTALEDVTRAVEEPDVDVLALEEALERLGAEDRRKLEIVQLRFYGGLTAEETAEVLGVSLRTVERDWRFARARLHLELGGEEGAQEGAQEGASETSTEPKP